MVGFGAGLGYGVYAVVLPAIDASSAEILAVSPPNLFLLFLCPCSVHSAGRLKRANRGFPGGQGEGFLGAVRWATSALALPLVMFRLATGSCVAQLAWAAAKRDFQR